MTNEATLEIVEQPDPKSMRFRYSSEGQTAGSILGVRSTEERKTYPSIRVLNYDGIVRVCVSCVTINEPAKPHPNSLIGQSCSRGICAFDIVTKAASPTLIKFAQLGIQCPKRDEIRSNLEKRKKLDVDPFRTGYEHKENPQSINLDQLRLCFQAFLLSSDKKCLVALKPITSNIIINKIKTNMKLSVYEKSDNVSPPCGDKKIMILCDKVNKLDIKIRFYEKGADGSDVWCDWAKFQPKDVHKQVGISFRTPKYRDQNIAEPVNVFFQLQTAHGKDSGDPVSFQYVPDVTNIGMSLDRKEGKICSSRELFAMLREVETANGQTSNMSCAYEPNVIGAENDQAEGFHFDAPAFHATDNSQQPSQRFQQNTNLLAQTLPDKTCQSQQSDYHRSSTQARCEQSQHFNQQQHYQSQPQFNMSNNGNFSSSAQGNYQSSAVNNNYTTPVCVNNFDQAQSVADAAMSGISSSELLALF